jgi:NADH:ubiquinone oxidoreductase subunit K
MKTTAITFSRWIVLGAILATIGILTLIARRRGSRLYGWRIALWALALSLMGSGSLLAAPASSGKGSTTVAIDNTGAAETSADDEIAPKCYKPMPTCYKPLPPPPPPEEDPDGDKDDDKGDDKDGDDADGPKPDDPVILCYEPMPSCYEPIAPEPPPVVQPTCYAPMPEPPPPPPPEPQPTCYAPMPVPPDAPEEPTS